MIPDARQPNHTHHTYQITFSVCIGVLSHPHKQSIESLYCPSQSLLLISKPLVSVSPFQMSYQPALPQTLRTACAFFCCYQPPCTHRQTPLQSESQISAKSSYQPDRAISLDLFSVLVSYHGPAPKLEYNSLAINKEGGNISQDWKNVEYLKKNLKESKQWSSIWITIVSLSTLISSSVSLAWCTEMPLSLVVMETAENLFKVSYVTQKTEHSLVFPLCPV